MKRKLLLLIWLPATLLTLHISLLTYSQIERTSQLSSLISIETRNILNSQTPFLAYAAIPETTKNISSAITSQDARPVVIDLYLERYDSPMQGFGQLVVDKSEQYGVNPYLFIAIMQQESNLGKSMPDDCNNGWGYGIHSRGTLCFDSWEQGIDVVMKGLKEKFLDKGLQTPEEIMTLYTPNSNGSWAFGVNQFMHNLQSGEF